MSSSVKVTSLCPPGESFFSVIFEIDNLKILVDCGCRDDNFDISSYDRFKGLLREVDCVLISHADVKYLGGLPFVMKKYGLSCPVYATLPVHNMGAMTLYDSCQSFAEEGPIESTRLLDEIDECFDKITRLRYQQTATLSGPGGGVMITPYSCGNSVGASIWRIQKNNQDLAYAVDFNHKKERHLDGLNFDTFSSKPSVLLTNADSIFCVHKNKKQRDADFIDLVLKTLRNGGTVLIPCKAATRILEVSLLLEQTWNSERHAFPVYFLSHQSYRTMEYAKSMLEWLGETVMKTFGLNRSNPFDFK